MLIVAIFIAIFFIGLELILWSPLPLPGRPLTLITLLGIIGSSIWLTYVSAPPAAVFYGFVGFYRAVNLTRLLYSRRQADHLYSAVRRASWWLIAAQAASLLLIQTAPLLPKDALLKILTGVALFGTVVMVLALQRNLAKTRPLRQLTDINDEDLPTVSVLIPARNETTDLNDCLTSLVRSTYPKLEIIVLDDCSQNQRTPEIIKGFAHDGVRFIAGTAEPGSWLAKNHAYQQLADTACGDILLYCGVDTRFQPLTITNMVQEMLQRRKTMISFLPANQVPQWQQFSSLLVQPSRYLWELALPRRLVDRPPVLSTAWLIRRDTLRAAGSFAAYSRSITPERFLARYAATHEDGYSFVQSDSRDGVASSKSPVELRATAIRSRYPQTHQSLELTALITVLEVIIVVLPFVVYFSYLQQPSTGLFIAADVTAILLIVIFAQICNVTYRRFLMRSIWLIPFAALYDICLLNYSLYKYEFSSVTWKGRNVCIPVMHVIDRLPKA